MALHRVIQIAVISAGLVLAGLATPALAGNQKVAVTATVLGHCKASSGERVARRETDAAAARLVCKGRTVQPRLVTTPADPARGALRASEADRAATGGPVVTVLF